MGVAYSVGEVDHLYTFFVQWSPDIYTKGNKKHRQPRYLIREKHQGRYLVIEKNKVAAINKLLSNPANPTAKNWEAYRWSGENSYFVSGNLESLQIGGGGGGFALWLDADLYHGASFSCPTFHNAPLSTQEDFIVQDLEVWTVQN